MECDHCGMYIKIRIQNDKRGEEWMARHSHPHCRHCSRSSLRVRTLYTSSVPIYRTRSIAPQAIPGPSAVTGALETVWYGLRIFCILFRHIHNFVCGMCWRIATWWWLTKCRVSLYCSAAYAAMRCDGCGGRYTGGFYIMMARWWKYAPDVIRTRI